MALLQKAEAWICIRKLDRSGEISPVARQRENERNSNSSLITQIETISKQVSKNPLRGFSF